MSNDQQQNEEKAPTIWNILGIGVLVGVFMGIVFFSIGKSFSFFGFGVVLIPTIAAIIGAGIGSLLPITNSNKWNGLWIGAGLAALLPICFIELIISGGIY